MSGKTLILSDAGPASLLACACIRESIALGQVGKGLAEAPTDAAVLPFPPVRPALQAIARQCELFTLPVLSPTAAAEPAAPSPEAESHHLLSATHLAARNGFTTVLWPASAAAGDSLDLDRIAQITDRALLVSRLVAIDADSHGAPSIRIETPYADLTDRQIADLIADMELPIESCWWWGAEAIDALADRESRRWKSALATVGRPARA
jgi:hypothetical protein